MAYVYILHSESIDKYYIGSCLDFESRLKEHLEGKYDSSFTKRAEDWKTYLLISDLDYRQARDIEFHIKRMKSRKYIENMNQYPELIEKLICRFFYVKCISITSDLSY